MKKFTLTLALIASALLAVSCYKDTEERILDLKAQISDLETKVSRINENAASLSELVSALEKNDHISSITEIYLSNPKAYRIVFTSGLTLKLTCGTDGVSPILGVSYNEQYEAYYWTIQMGPNGKPTWMTNSYGMRVRASGTVPRLKIEDNTWYYTFDGSSWNKCNWGPAQGQPGASVFSQIDTSNPYFVLFVMAGSGYNYFRIPTETAFNELTSYCDLINQGIAMYSKFIKELNANLFVESVTEFREGGDTGYRITLESGRVLSIRNGRSSQDSVLLSALPDTDGKYYWVYRSRTEEEFQWLLYNGEKVCVTQEDATPTIGLTESMGHIYFTITFRGETELMKDPDGNPVEATGKIVLDFFTAADTSDPYFVSLTMSDGTVIRLPRAVDHAPSVQFMKRSEGVTALTDYSYQLLAIVRDTLSSAETIPTYDAYVKKILLKTDAISLDEGCYVTDLNVVIFEANPVEGGIEYTTYYNILFSTGPSTDWDNTRPFRIAFFLSWQNKSLVKVSQFNRIIPATAVYIHPLGLNLKEEETATMSYTLQPANTTDTTVVWQSSNPAVATVSDEGVVTAVAPGTCIITVRAGKQYSNCTCIVETNATITLDVTEVNVLVGGTATITANVTPSEKASSLVWSSSDPGIATVSTAGVVSGVAAGSCTISATIGTVKVSVPCTVTTP